MDILTDNNLEEIMEEVKNMGMAKLSEDNMNFLMDAVKKFELDKMFTDKGIEQGRQNELLKTVTKQLYFPREQISYLKLLLSPLIKNFTC
jgi:hypothetical protein